MQLTKSCPQLNMFYSRRNKVNDKTIVTQKLVFGLPLSWLINTGTEVVGGQLLPYFLSLSAPSPLSLREKGDSFTLANGSGTGYNGPLRYII